MMLIPKSRAIRKFDHPRRNRVSTFRRTGASRFNCLVRARFLSGTSDAGFSTSQPYSIPPLRYAITRFHEPRAIDEK
jgi:hypothetical protein